MVARALELFPVGIREDEAAVVSLTTKTTPEAQRKVSQANLIPPSADGNTLISISQQQLEHLWHGGEGHIAFDTFIQSLRTCAGNAVHWTDSGGRVRTLRPVWRRPFMKTITNTDPTSSTASLKRGIIRFKQHERGYVKLDAASALAITRLAVKDMHNFARIVAADPSIIEVLLDSKKIGHGPIFTEANIWLVLAYTIPRLRALGGQTTAEFRSLTFAFENYLTFHNTDNLGGPYVEPLRWAYEGSGQKADALANSWPHFAKNIERI